MDRDFDGFLSFEEFIGDERNIEKLLKNMDKNGDGVVTKEVGAVEAMAYGLLVLSLIRRTEP